MGASATVDGEAVSAGEAIGDGGGKIKGSGDTSEMRSRVRRQRKGTDVKGDWRGNCYDGMVWLVISSE